MSERTTAAVVVVSWDVPTHRLHDHLAWNAELYEGVRLFVVTDQVRPWMPPWATCVVFERTRLPLIQGRHRFSLTRTKNAGLREAIRAGHSPVICSDVDIWFQPDAWQEMIETKAGRAVVPVYLNSTSDDPVDALDHIAVEATGATGTVCLTAADWIRTGGFCEGQWGYGCDDGLIVERILALDPPVSISRQNTLVHMAHQPGTPQVEFDKDNPRTDHWNRGSGFNPENFNHNRRYHVVDKRLGRHPNALGGLD